MTETTVVLSMKAKADIAEILNYLLPRAGAVVAHAYVDEIIDYCQGFSLFPNRGTLLNHKLRMRTVGFNRQATIIFRVGTKQVTILRVFHRGRDISLDAL